MVRRYFGGENSLRKFDKHSEVKYIDCGKTGLYGPNQKSWYLTEQVKTS